MGPAVKVKKRKEVAMGKIKVRGCIHCQNGEVFVDHDMYGWYETCLQCGYSHDLPDIMEPAAEECKDEVTEGQLVKRRVGYHR